ncbi:hypothetical protein COX64_04195 [Candidatus Dojkabacteria bacterium CG_4_10_14_0_2_um_filter_Dojkabacteria_WS6_41_15]|uniref:NodB homology domain-containing protein n=1 Tax=Candidatus Dojkabacteria bacterium CG_4_10_14_0_2_um_filter_Dojkabacteria_WS6_41_15 TaxID=2014249 RepID=A0A2M7W1W2_9BACT|nr:MAG: hypothetical protein COX64_04195 [Candidatus Dojkabacteria bacterium CG_4_10_14_0_2_um_filter_Dojkabacteria_WS6_41_15]
MGNVVESKPVGNNIGPWVPLIVGLLIVAFPLFVYVYKGKELLSISSNSASSSQLYVPTLPTYDNVIVATTVAPTLTVLPTATPTPSPVNNNNFSLDYDYKPTKQAKGTVRIPILTYHHIAKMPKDKASRAYYVTPETFEKQLAYLKAKNYKVITSQQFYNQVKSGKNPKQKMVMLTFDDGNKDSYTNAFPLLKKYGFTGVFYINNKRLKISAKQLKEMSDNGMVIDSHTASHIDLKKENNQSVLNSEITSSKSVLEGITNRKVVSVSYPGCTFDTQVVNTAAKAGYKFGVSCGKSIDHRPGALFGLSRMHIYSDLENFKKRLSGYWVMP